MWHLCGSDSQRKPILRLSPIFVANRYFNAINAA
jgi:hypothetical protein